ncbi:enolase C-terminal domain-like protein [uncultured Gimesia sp.]|uniref:enolase C-terminal domain-like protein n=1 Tax=uncultured Gimesia sp. TaxID=1678688 RepID=UPI0030D90BC5|tara:strand:+ start:18176 stop:19372 length:1197 start_codon:yes stop_codon:yes gene_type:complete
MRIAQISAYQVRVPLRRKITHASFSRSESQSIIVRCQLTDGTVGWGESVPREYVTGESVKSVFSQYENTDFLSMLGDNWHSLNELIALCQEITSPTPTDSPAEYLHRGCFGNAARCALEISLIDAATRAENVSFSKIFQHLEPCQNLLKPQTTVRYSGVLTSMKPVKQYMLALVYRLTGFQQCKVKVGLPQIDDQALFRKLRLLTGSKMNLRVDANEAWTREILEEKDREFTPFKVSSIEQPVAHQNIASLRDIRNQIATPVMLDESLCSQQDAEQAITEGYCDYFNLRISKLGGVIPTLQIAHLAQQAGLKYQLGCQVGETGILSAAGRHFATSVKGITFLEGSFDRFLLVQNLINEEISFGWGGAAPTLMGPGLGITVNEQRLAQLTQREQHWKLC